MGNPANAGTPLRMKKAIKLQQGQAWRLGVEYFRIVHLERLEVEYKSSTSLPAQQGTHHKVSKKEFCRLLKSASLLTPAEIPAAPIESTRDKLP